MQNSEDVAHSHIFRALMFAYQRKLRMLLSAAEHEVQEGYFAVGQEVTLVAKPGSRLQGWLKRHNGQRIVIRLEPDPASE